MKTTEAQRAEWRVLSGIGNAPTLLKGIELRVLLDDLEAALKETPTADAVIWREACNKALKQRDAALVLLRRLEWSSDTLDVCQCPDCGRVKSRGHRAGCELAALLAEANCSPAPAVGRCGTA